MKGMDILRILQLLAALLGVVFATQCSVHFMVIVVYAVTLTYTIVLVIAHLASRSVLSTRAQLCTDLVVGLSILVVTIVALLSDGKSTWAYACIGVGFVETALFFITVYERI